MSEERKVTIEFDLPIGVTNETGTHRKVTMRRVTNSDLIQVHKDVRIQGLAKQQIALQNNNPVAESAALTAMNEVYSMLYTRVVESIGAITNPRRDVFDDMYLKDRSFMFEKYCELNEIPLGVEGEGSSLPLAPGAS